MTLARRTALSAAVTLSVASLFALGLPAAYAAPGTMTVLSGSATISVDGAVTTITQSTPHATVSFDTFDVAAGEEILIVQPVSQPMVVSTLTVVVANAAPTVLAGSVSAQAGIVIQNENGISVADQGFVGGSHVVLTSGAVVDGPVGAADATIVVDPAAGPVAISPDAMVGGTSSVSLIAPDITVAGAVTTSWFSTVSAAEVFLPSATLLPVGMLDIGGGVITIVSDALLTVGDIYVEGSPSSGAIASYRLVAGGGQAGKAVEIIGNVTTSMGDLIRAFHDVGTSPTFATAIGADLLLPVALSGQTYVWADANVASSGALMDSVTVGDGVAATEVIAECLATNGSLLGVADVASLTFNGTSIVPADYDFTVPNQPAFDVPGLGQVRLYTEVRTVVAGSERLQVTAIEVAGPAGNYPLGRAICNGAATTTPPVSGETPQPQLAVSGSSFDGTPLAVALAVLVLGAVVVVRRRVRA